MVDVYEICKKLKPLIGQQADRYWLAYLAEDSDGKRELADTLQLRAVQLLGLDFENPAANLSVPPKTEAEGEYPVGTLTYAGRSLYPFGLRESEWLQHISIFGRSGAGKTNTVFLLIKNLLHHKKPFLIFDWKRNYRDLLAGPDKKTMVYTVGGDISPFAFNPLIPPKGVAPEIWLKKLIEIIAHAYYLGEGVMYLLQEAIHAVYGAFGVYKGVNKSFPTFVDILHWLENHPVRGRKSLWMDSAMRGIKSICFGCMGKVVNSSMQSDLAALLQQNVILELDRLTNADKTLIVESMLLWIHHYRLGEPDRETFKHALIIEEAHHILAKKTPGQGGESITETVIREIRELGEAIIVVDQHPSMISTVALGNTSVTICLNLKHRSDVTAMASAMLMDTDEREILGMLPIGSAVVKLQNRWQRPFQITIPHQKVEKGAVTDAHLAQLMQTSKASQVVEVNEKADSSLPAGPGRPFGFRAAIHELDRRGRPVGDHQHGPLRRRPLRAGQRGGSGGANQSGVYPRARPCAETPHRAAVVRPHGAVDVRRDGPVPVAGRPAGIAGPPPGNEVSLPFPRTGGRPAGRVGP